MITPIKYGITRIIFLAIFCIIQANSIFSQTKNLRIISLAPSTTEILFALGLDDEIVGVSSYCDYPPQAKSKTKVGGFSHPNLEKIFSLKPDYIFCTGLEQAPVIAQLRRLNFKVYVADPKNIEELFKSISDIGRITNKVGEADRLIKRMKSDIAIVSNKTKAIAPQKKAKVFIEIWYDPLMTAGTGSFIDELITLAGGINIAHDVKRPYSNFSAEKIVSLNPDCIIMAYMDKKSALKLVTARFGWENINAVKNKRVFNDIDPDILLRPGPRITEGLKAIHKKLYPQE
ncbi:MAG: cobalamin-binding protein [Candidatus Omnitrophota bacterium]|nr:cobalamin-binding protein [Candidatus Omnitrophota bacterium]